MKMRKHVFKAIVSKLSFFRHYGLPHLILSGNRSSRDQSLSCWFQRTGRESGRHRWASTHPQSGQYQAVGYLDGDSLRGEDSWNQAVSSDVSRDGMLKIGVLDDNTVILSLIETVLSMEGHRVFKHTSGSSLLEALFPQKFTEALYDLVILDLLLPGAQSGTDVFFAIRQQFSADILPIIVITAVDEPTLQQFRHILPDDVPLLRKPFDPRELRQLIAELTGQMVKKG
jgi:CheY-like chemotaxis protein